MTNDRYAAPRVLTAAGRFSGPRSRAWDVTDRAAKLAAAGADIIQLGIGDPDFDTPAAISEAAVAALQAGRTHYSPFAGEPALRQAIAHRASEQHGLNVSPDQVVVFPGAQCALFATMLCLAEAGDEIILFEPAYTTYDAVARSGGARIVHVPLAADGGFQPDVRLVEAAVTEKTRAILVNTPGNPSGTVFDAGPLQGLVALCRRHGIWLVSDEVYWSLVYEGRHVSPLALAGGTEVSFVVNSLSKSHAMTGWRLGWTIAPRDLAHHLGDLAQGLLFGVTQFVQDAAVAALTQDLAEVAAMREIFKRRRDALCAGLAAIPGLKIHKPSGGMFLLVDVGDLGCDGAVFANALLDEAGVTVVPGFAFGDSTRDCVRIGFLRDVDVLEEAVRRIAAFVARRATGKGWAP
jgi:arginine:pyruvate transaminase